MFRFLTTSRGREEADTQHAAPIAFWETGGRGSCQAANLFDITLYRKARVRLRWNFALPFYRQQQREGAAPAKPQPFLT